MLVKQVFEAILEIRKRQISWWSTNYKDFSYNIDTDLTIDKSIIDS